MQIQNTISSLNVSIAVKSSRRQTSANNAIFTFVQNVENAVANCQRKHATLFTAFSKAYSDMLKQEQAIGGDEYGT
jgi:hypothetical protein